jgi:hypothetical protein
LQLGCPAGTALASGARDLWENKRRKAVNTMKKTHKAPKKSDASRLKTLDVEQLKGVLGMGMENDPHPAASCPMDPTPRVR